MTFRARVDAPAFDQPGQSVCSYKEDESVTCDTASVTYNSPTSACLERR